MPSVFRPNKVCLKLLEDNASETLIDLDALSGLAEISLEVEEGSGVKYITKLGVSTGPPLSRVVIPSQVVTMVPRHVVVNESEQRIIVRQCYLQVCSQCYFLEGAFLFFSFLLTRPFYLFVCLFNAFYVILALYSDFIISFLIVKG